MLLQQNTSQRKIIGVTMHNEHLSEGSLILKPIDVFIYLNIINVINEVLELSNGVEVYPVCKYRIM